MSLLRELVCENEDQIDAIPLMEALEEAVRTTDLRSKGGLTKAVGGAKELFAQNPSLAIGAAAMAVSAFAEYEKNKRNTIRLHAKTDYEKKMMTSIADALKQSGKFKLHKIKFEGGGKTWVLRRVWTS